MANPPDAIPEREAQTLEIALYEPQIKEMINRLGSGTLPRVEATTYVPFLKKDGSPHNLTDVAEYFFERDQDWWSLFNTKLISEVVYYKQDGTLAESDILETGSWFTQKLFLPGFGEINHVVRVELLQNRYYRTIAVPHVSKKSVPLGYIADFIQTEDLIRNRIGLQLIGHLHHPRLGSNKFINNSLTAPINILTKFAMGVMLGNRIKSGQYEQALRSRRNKTGEP